MSIPLTKQEAIVAERERNARAAGLISQPGHITKNISFHSPVYSVPYAVDTINMPPFHHLDPKRPDAHNSETLGKLPKHIREEIGEVRDSQRRVKEEIVRRELEKENAEKIKEQEALRRKHSEYLKNPDMPDHLVKLRSQRDPESSVPLRVEVGPARYDTLDHLLGSTRAKQWDDPLPHDAPYAASWRRQFAILNRDRIRSAARNFEVNRKTRKDKKKLQLDIGETVRQAYDVNTGKDINIPKTIRKYIEKTDLEDAIEEYKKDKGGKRSRKHKSRKYKSRKYKSRKDKSRKHKSRKH